MKVDLRFQKEGDKVIIQDVSEYNIDDLKSLYKTMKLTYDLKYDQKKNLFEQEKQVTEELEIIKNRLNQIEKFMESEGISLEEETNENNSKN